MPDCVRRVEDEAAAAEKSPSDNVFFLRVLAPACDGVSADQREALERRQILRRQRRARWNQPLASIRWMETFCNAHATPHHSVVRSHHNAQVPQVDGRPALRKSLVT